MTGAACVFAGSREIASGYRDELILRVDTTVPGGARGAPENKVGGAIAFRSGHPASVGYCVKTLYGAIVSSAKTTTSEYGLTRRKTKK